MMEWEYQNVNILEISIPILKLLAGYIESLSALDLLGTVVVGLPPQNLETQVPMESHSWPD